MKTVKEVAEITGVSIRTLRYYDEIGLLKPAELTDAGYRLYDRKALMKLQEIMFYRELEIPLVDIKALMEHPDYDKGVVLRTQKALLENKRNRLDGIIELISDVMKGVNTMRFDEFDENDVEEMLSVMQGGMTREQFDAFIQEYGKGSVDSYKNVLLDVLKDEKNSADFLKWYGSKEKVIGSVRPVENMEERRDMLDGIYKELAEVQKTGVMEREHELIAQLAKSYKTMLNLDNARSFLLDLAKEYLQNPKLAQANDRKYGEGSARYIAKSIQRYYGE